MAWQDRAYYRDSNRHNGGGNPFMWLLTGSVSLGSWFGINVRLHAMLIICIVIALLFPNSVPGGAFGSLTFSVILFASVLLHEFGHCVGSWSVGGNPTEIILTPLGGQALADAPRRPWATFWTVLCGPLVNLILCALSVGAIYAITHSLRNVPWNPLSPSIILGHQILFYATWVFTINWGLFAFNVFWPAFPLDGGQMLQSLLWVKIGYYKSMNIACTVGLVLGIVMVMSAIVSLNWLLGFIGASCVMTCIQMRAQIKAAGPWGFEDESNDYAAAMWNDSPTPTRRASGKHVSKRVLKRAQKEARDAEIEQTKIDAILAKVSAHGMHSLTWGEKRTLHKATERQRQMEESPTRKHR